MVSGLLKVRLPFLIERHLRESLINNNLKQYPDDEMVKTSIINAFEEANREIVS